MQRPAERRRLQLATVIAWSALEVGRHDVEIVIHLTLKIAVRRDWISPRLHLRTSVLAPLWRFGYIDLSVADSWAYTK